SRLTQLHEAAHGWFGDGVRIACWEDFVLSEGMADYLSARAAEAAVGPDYVKLVWTSYKNTLDQIVANPDWDTVALPDTCNKIDLLHDKLWSGVPYVKGAFFMR